MLLTLNLFRESGLITIKEIESIKCKVGGVRLRKIQFYEILFIYNYLGLKRTLALQKKKAKQTFKALVCNAKKKKLSQFYLSKKCV